MIRQYNANKKRPELSNIRREMVLPPCDRVENSFLIHPNPVFDWVLGFLRGLNPVLKNNLTGFGVFAIFKFLQ